MLTFPKTI